VKFDKLKAQKRWWHF